MNHTYSLDQIQKTDDLNAGLIMRQYKLDEIAEFMEIKSNNPKLKQSEIAKLLDLSSSTIQRYKKEIKMLSPYRIPPSSKTNRTRKQKLVNTKLDDVKVTSNDLEMTTNDLKTTSNNERVTPKKNKLKSVGNIEINKKYLDENFRNIDL